MFVAVCLLVAEIVALAFGRTRTCNLLLRRQLLYPLSYERISFHRLKHLKLYKTKTYVSLL